MARQLIEYIDTHTGGEPTRVIMAGGPPLGNGSLVERRDMFRTQFDPWRSAMVNEPRGSDVMVGALIVPPVDPSCAAGVIFFNNVGCLGMCGHGTIGVVVALAEQGLIKAGRTRLETAVGIVEVDFQPPNTVTLTNVPSYCYRQDAPVEVPGLGLVTGDIAWAGNWFFLVTSPQIPLNLTNVRELTDITSKIKHALAAQAITGDDGGEIDHIELFGPAVNPQHHSRNFVLCPGLAYDRSPCGTGTSAKLACLAAKGKLQPGEVWYQESIVGSIFAGSYQISTDGKILPTITGTAFVNGKGTLILDDADPFCWGIRVS
jgi:4-hydroxyproline epimerase